MGDYPDVGVVTYEQKDPYDNYSCSLFRRYWGEPVSASNVLLSFILEKKVPRQFVRYRPDRWSYTGLDEEDFET